MLLCVCTLYVFVWHMLVSSLFFLCVKLLHITHTVHLHTFIHASACAILCQMQKVMKARDGGAKNNYTIYSQGDQHILIGGEWINLCAPLLVEPRLKWQALFWLRSRALVRWWQLQTCPSYHYLGVDVLVCLCVWEVGISVENSYHCNQNSLINPAST